MADWIKIRHSLIRSPKLYALARELKCKKHAALGVAISWLVWIDEQTEDGRTHLSPDELADEIGFRGCAEALISIGWAALGCDGCVEAVEFGKHCGESAKKRAENALRKARSRTTTPKCHTENVTNVTQSVTPNARPEKKRKEYTKVSSSTTVDTRAAAQPPPPPPHLPEDLREWLAALCSCVPQLAALRALPADVEAAAAEAYRCLPQAADYAPLLTAYYADRLAEDRRRQPFWRPMGAQFFRELPDVLYKHALRWARETAWGKPAAGAPTPAPTTTPPDLTPQDRDSFFRELKKELR